MNLRCLVFVLGVGSAGAQLLSQAGPTFRVSDSELTKPLVFVTYGDQRFEDVNEKGQSNPDMRQLLVKKIAEEKPAAVILNGDIPNSGRNKNDYAVYQTETQLWRDAKLRVMPALGNHEMNCLTENECLENWWDTFPELRNRRWYSTQLGSRIYIIALDSVSPLLPETEQGRWLRKQMDGIPASVDFVIFTMHHPPSADVQTRYEVNHNPRPNEMSLRDYLTVEAKKVHARILVSAGHIHNYERHEVSGVIYLVSGGGGATPYPVDRTPDDLYQGKEFPNYNYVKLVLEGNRLRGTMFRADNPDRADSGFTVKDSFEIVAKPR